MESIEATQFVRKITQITVLATVALLGWALVRAMPADWPVLLIGMLLKPEGVGMSALAALGLIGLIECCILLPHTPAAADPALQLALFPGMPLAVGIADQNEG
ncbi:MAG: hypothetical protein Fur005_07320 [Roseiflexaceae bacterium]